MNLDFYTIKKMELIKKMRETGAIKSKEVEMAFMNVKRELFIPPFSEKQVYDDSAQQIAERQTISQPSTIAIMLEMLKVKQGEKVLEVGSGSGYVLALLSELVGEKGNVYGIEALKDLVEISKKNIINQNCKNVEIFLGDGSVGIEKKSKFDKIIVSAACPFFPKSLFDQLQENGKGVAPVGDKGTQMIQAISKKNNLPVKTDYLSSYFVFVPLLGKEGFKNEF